MSASVRVLAAAVMLIVLCACRSRGHAGDANATLTFLRDGRTLRTMDLDSLERIAGEQSVAAYDPYYQRAKRFVALPLEPILRAAYGAGLDLAHQQFVLRARDGYTLPIDGARLLEGGASLAIADEDVPGWEPIGPQRANPGPFYLVWSRPGQQDLETHPRPWQLASFEITAFERVFPHTVPDNAPEGSPARRGFALFRADCMRCHAINREGGHVGPELNVPQSIVEYRPEAQIRAFVRNPLTFRYSNMPPHPALTDDDLDALVAYLHAMAAHKFDPQRAPGAAP